MTTVLCNRIVQQVIQWIQQTPISTSTWAFYIRSIHVHAPLYFLLLLLWCPFRSVCQCILALLCFTLVCLYVFHGCIVSKLERELDGQDITIIDPFVYLSGQPCRHTNRLIMSYIIGISYMIGAFALYRSRRFKG